MREIVPFQWIEETTASRHGDGISRPRPKTRTREYRLIIFKPGAQPMTWITRAETKRAAICYAENRWPGAAVEAA
jgi:hypothetical protein